MKILSRLYAHLAWADQAVLEGLERAGPGETRGLELFAHVLGAEHVWLARLEGREPRVAVWPSLTLENCRALALENNRGFTALLSGLDSSALEQEVRYVNSAGQSFQSRMDDILLHVCLHGSYHRGQIAWLLRSGGNPPSPTDYIAFIRGAPAATRPPG